jgi:hypothetical protein
MTRSMFPLVAFGIAALLGGCISHDVQFQGVDYSIGAGGAAKDAHSSVVVVIGAETLTKRVTIHSWMAGIGNDWDVEPGAMMSDVVLTEFPQQFADFQQVGSYVEPKGGRALTVVLTIPEYRFADFHASVTVHAVAYGAGRRVLLDRDYPAEGFTQGAKMFFGGAFAMKSALRQSSLDAYKKIFSELRPDLQRALDAPPGAP